MLTLCIVDESGEDVDRNGIDANHYDAVSECVELVFLVVMDWHLCY